ncbi:MAG: carboxypeptidase-like regulatory domain-containing protein, partial [Candidatus Sulfotelmatobacter sp.]
MISKSIFVGALLVVLSALPLFAQTSGSFTGTVVDATDAAVVGAQVLVTDPSTGLRRKTTTNSDGNYLIAGLGAGSYDITIRAPGFKTFEGKHVILRVGEKVRVDTKLEIGKITSEIVVQGSAVG